MKDALAYYNYGRWVADCPWDGCTDALALHPEDRQTGRPSAQPQLEQVCRNGHPLRFVLPPEDFRRKVERVLADRQVEADRAWLPTGHPWGATYGYPTGQSVEDLERESVEVAKLRAQRNAKRGQLEALLHEFGVAVGPDGRIQGTL